MSSSNKTPSVIVRCETKHTLTLEGLSSMAFQPDDFKIFPPESKEKLKRSLVTNGIFVPIFVWKEKQKILDGHHRVRVLVEMSEDGVGIPKDIPVVMISATDEKDAAKKVLLMNSRYAQITQEGFEAFIESHEIGEDVFEEIDIAEVEAIDPDFDASDDQEDEEPNNPNFEQFKCGSMGGAVRTDDGKAFRTIIDSYDQGSLVENFSLLVEDLKKHENFKDIFKSNNG